MKNRLCIAINAQFMPGGGSGGVEVAVTELIAALGELTERDDRGEEYVVITPYEQPRWLEPFMKANQRIVQGSPPGGNQELRVAKLKNTLAPLLPLARRVRRAFAAPVVDNTSWMNVPATNGFFEKLGCDVVHFPYQPYRRVAVPTIYNPHDLQHLHFPQFFTDAEIKRREEVYRAGCTESETIVVASQWVKQDVVTRYGVSPDKVQVIPWAAPSHLAPEPDEATLTATSFKYKVTRPFALYPAATWEHKNHLRLIEAVTLLRDRDDLRIDLICTGNRTPFYKQIVEQIERCGVAEQIKFTGSIPAAELRALYRLAEFVVIPTLFEAASAPLFEAWQDGVAVACANVTSLPEQAADAALLFCSTSVEAIAAALKRLHTTPGLRRDLRKRGRIRLRDFSWERTAKAYRAVYARAAGRALDEEEQWLLSWDWMRDARRGRTATTE